jgi:hypothetical protein
MSIRVVTFTVGILAATATTYLASADGDAGTDASVLAFDAEAPEAATNGDDGNSSDGNLEDGSLPAADGSDLGLDASTQDGGNSAITDASRALDALAADASDASSIPARIPDLNLPGENCSFANSAPTGIAAIVGLHVVVVAVLSRRRKRRS